jgi:hypothetical protein
MEQNKLPSATRQAHCNTCLGERSHEVIFELNEEWCEEVTDDPRDNRAGTELYEILKCAGCGHVVFRNTITYLNECDDDGRPKKIVCYFPSIKTRKKPALLSVVSGSIQFIKKDEFLYLLDEIYSALYAENPLLAAMGIRALIEYIMLGKISDQGSFKENLAQFNNSGFIAEKEKDMLGVIVEVGSAAIHRGHKPAMDVVVSCLDIVEALLKRIYLFPGQIQAIKKTIPERKKNKSKGADTLKAP